MAKKQKKSVPVRKLSPADSKIFANMLKNPGKPNKALTKAAARYKGAILPPPFDMLDDISPPMQALARLGKKQRTKGLASSKSEGLAFKLWSCYPSILNINIRPPREDETIMEYLAIPGHREALADDGLLLFIFRKCADLTGMKGDVKKALGRIDWIRRDLFVICNQLKDEINEMD